MKTKRNTLMTVLAIVIVCSFAVSWVQAKPEPNPLKNVYFGEQHLHTQNSPDAFAAGGRMSWDSAYEWAMGKEVTL